MASFLWNLRAHYQVQNIFTLGPISSQINPVHILESDLVGLVTFHFIHSCHSLYFPYIHIQVKTKDVEIVIVVVIKIRPKYSF